MTSLTKNQGLIKNCALTKIKMHSSIWGRDGFKGHGRTQSQGGRTAAEWKQMGEHQSMSCSEASLPCRSAKGQWSIPVPNGPRTWCSSLNGYGTSIVLSNNTDEVGDPWLLKVKRHKTHAPPLLLGSPSCQTALRATSSSRLIILQDSLGWVWQSIWQQFWENGTRDRNTTTKNGDERNTVRQEWKGGIKAW